MAQTIDVLGVPRDVAVVNGTTGPRRTSPGVAAQGSVVRIDADAWTVTATVKTGRFIDALAAEGDTLWATNLDDGTLSVIDTADATLVATTPIGDRPGGVAFGHGSIWVTPHRRAALVRIDPRQTLEAAAEPDLSGAVELDNGTVYIRCSGSGSPTVLLESNQGEGAGAWAVVEARLSWTTCVCSYDRIGVADPAQSGQAGPAGTIAFDLGAALAAVHQRGPYVMVGEQFGALYAQMFVATHRADVVGLVLVDPVSPDLFTRLRPLLPPEAVDEMDQLFAEPDMRTFDESAAQVAAIGGFGDLPLVVVIGARPTPDASATTSIPDAESEAVTALLQAVGREQARLSTDGRLVVAGGTVSAADVVGAIESLVG